MEITMSWVRLVDESGETCYRCGSTEASVDSAYIKLRDGLERIGINIKLEKTELDLKTFLERPIQSNQVTLDGRTIEQWLNGKTGQSKCCGPCGDAECRTVEIEGRIYEEIPEVLIIQAGLLAAAAKLSGNGSQSSCSCSC